MSEVVGRRVRSITGGVDEESVRVGLTLGGNEAVMMDRARLSDWDFSTMVSRRASLSVRVL